MAQRCRCWAMERERRRRPKQAPARSPHARGTAPMRQRPPARARARRLRPQGPARKRWQPPRRWPQPLPHQCARCLAADNGCSERPGRRPSGSESSGCLPSLKPPIAAENQEHTSLMTIHKSTNARSTFRSQLMLPPRLT